MLVSLCGASTFTRAFHLTAPCAQKRTLTVTPSPDRALLERFLDSQDPYKTRNYSLQHPKVLAKYVQVSQAMQQEGLIPFVHGRQASWYIPETVLKLLGFSGTSLLRLPEAANKDAASVKAMMQEHAQNVWTMLLPSWLTRTDHQTALRTHLLATTIGLFHTEYHETPLSFVFGGCASKYDITPGNFSVLSDKKTLKLQHEMIRYALSTKGYDNAYIDTLLDALGPLFTKANLFENGQLLVVGLPFEQCDRYAYHCKPFGIPTGLSIRSILQRMQRSDFLNDDNYQARLLLCKETMQPDSGIQVVNVMDSQDPKVPVIDSAFSRLLTKKEAYSDHQERATAAFCSFQQEFDQVLQRFGLLNLQDHGYRNTSGTLNAEA